ncbi:MAG: Xaa-Pro peptidase family protein [Pseudomonadota bacterium]
MPPAEPLNLHFDRTEFEARLFATLNAMNREGLSALLLFRQESMYWLTGYDTFGYVHFQAMVLTDEGDFVLLTRSADRLQASFTSLVSDVRIWRDEEGATPEVDLRSILSEFGKAGGKIGVEWDAYGLTAAKGMRVSDALDGVKLCDASLLVTRLRAVKSDTEIGHVRRAAALADSALDAAVSATSPGAFEGDILAELQGTIYRGGGDDPANEQIIGSGAGALMCRYYSGRRILSADDMLTLEFAAAWRHYHAAAMRTFVIGRVDARLRAMHAACYEALMVSEEALRPGEPAGLVYEAHARTMKKHHQSGNALNACGYSLGATYAPSWMDWPMLYAGQSYPLRKGNVFFLHMILFDADAGLGMSLGRTSVVTETGSESLSRAPLELVHL